MYSWRKPVLRWSWIRDIATTSSFLADSGFHLGRGQTTSSKGIKSSLIYFINTFSLSALSIISLKESYLPARSWPFIIFISIISISFNVDNIFKTTVFSIHFPFVAVCMGSEVLKELSLARATWILPIVHTHIFSDEKFCLYQMFQKGEFSFLLCFIARSGLSRQKSFGILYL